MEGEIEVEDAAAIPQNIPTLSKPLENIEVELTEEQRATVEDAAAAAKLPLNFFLLPKPKEMELAPPARGISTRRTMS